MSPNDESRVNGSEALNDPTPGVADNLVVSETELPNWHLQEWLAHFGKRQAALVNELGWDKAKANFIYHGKQHYRRKDVAEVASWLGLQPYEVLMRPADAMALRRLRESAKTIAAGDVDAALGDAVAGTPRRSR